MKLTMAKRELDYPGHYLGSLRDSTDQIQDTNELSSRLAEDGYLLLRGLLHPDRVWEARRELVSILADRGALETGTPDSEAIARVDGAFRGDLSELTQSPAFIRMVTSDEVMRFFERIRGGPIATYDYRWLRVVGPDGFTGAHYDIVYMGRGTPNVLTCWIPIGDITYDMGPLAILSGSHRLEAIRRTYGKMDVDRDNIAGWFSSDPVEMVDRYGGKWLTTEFQAGDALIFGMYVMHGSLTNRSNRFRISSDTRYQLASEPFDDRWVGRKPKGHYAWMKGTPVSMEDARRNWQV